ncbi:MAG: hypothetical protein H7836_03455 [Magnetococcus sp. YQC-3]
MLRPCPYTLSGGYAECLREFSSNGIIRVEGEQIFLTPQGKTRAARVVRCHRLGERLPVDLLGKPAVQVGQDACRFEHLLAAGLVDAICMLQGHPQSCLHAFPSPPGPCCTESRPVVHSIV